MLFQVHMKSAHRGFSAINGASDSRYLPHPLPKITTEAAKERQPVRVTRAPPCRWSGRAFSPGPKEKRGETRGRNAPPASGKSPGSAGRGSRPTPKFTPGGPRPSPPALRPSPPDSQTCKVGGRGSFHFHFTSGWRLAPSAARLSSILN